MPGGRALPTYCTTKHERRNNIGVAREVIKVYTDESAHGWNIGAAAISSRQGKTY